MQELISISKKTKIAASLMILLAFIWLKPFKISWLESNTSQRIVISIVNNSGEELFLAPSFFGVYENHFYKNKFRYLIPYKTLPVSGLGYTFRDELIKLTPDKIDSYLDHYGTNKYSESKSEKFYHFLTTYIRNHQAKVHSSVTMPHYFFQAKPVELKKIRSIRVYQNLKNIEIEKNSLILIKSIDLNKK
jgi:hypothetical protein